MKMAVLACGISDNYLYFLTQEKENTGRGQWFGFIKKHRARLRPAASPV
jgi:hypothetical protein